jgi:DNA polymerase III alpha subunit
MDIDIDLPSTFNPQRVFEHVVPASMITNGELKKHNCGVYFQDMKVDPVTGVAAIPYDVAESLGYFKIDFLHLTLLNNFSSKQEIRDLANKEPDWELLLNENNVAKLFQIAKHASLIKRVRPTSVIELADVIALIRPGKRQLLDDYLRNKTKVRPLLYRQGDDDKSAFKRSHAVAYALTIVLQLHLIKQGRL